VKLHSQTLLKIPDSQTEQHQPCNLSAPNSLSLLAEAKQTYAASRRHVHDWHMSTRSAWQNPARTTAQTYRHATLLILHPASTKLGATHEGATATAQQQ
jgi:hypothetical protein